VNRADIICYALSDALSGPPLPKSIDGEHRLAREIIAREMDNWIDAHVAPALEAAIRGETKSAAYADALINFARACARIHRSNRNGVPLPTIGGQLSDERRP